MPGKCLSAQTEGDKCCWRGHDKLATVNLRTRSPTGGPGVDAILHDCWMRLTALMKRINTHTQHLHHHLHHHTHTTSTASAFLLHALWCSAVPPWQSALVLIKVWFPQTYLMHFMKAIQALAERRAVSKLWLPNRAMTEVQLQEELNLPYGWSECVKFPHAGGDFFSRVVVMTVHNHESLTEGREHQNNRTPGFSPPNTEQYHTISFYYAALINVISIKC